MIRESSLKYLNSVFASDPLYRKITPDIKPYETLCTKSCFVSKKRKVACNYLRLSQTHGSKFISSSYLFASPFSDAIVFQESECFYRVDWRRTGTALIKVIAIEEFGVGYEAFDVNGERVTFGGDAGSFTLPGLIGAFAFYCPEESNLQFKIKRLPIPRGYPNPYKVGAYGNGIEEVYRIVRSSGEYRLVVAPRFLAYAARIRSEYLKIPYRACSPVPRPLLIATPSAINEINLAISFEARPFNKFETRCTQTVLEIVLPVILSIFAEQFLGYALGVELWELAAVETGSIIESNVGFFEYGFRYFFRFGDELGTLPAYLPETISEDIEQLFDTILNKIIADGEAVANSSISIDSETIVMDLPGGAISLSTDQFTDLILHFITQYRINVINEEVNSIWARFLENNPILPATRLLKGTTEEWSETLGSGIYAGLYEFRGVNVLNSCFSCASGEHYLDASIHGYKNSSLEELKRTQFFTLNSTNNSFRLDDGKTYDIYINLKLNFLRYSVLPRKDGVIPSLDKSATYCGSMPYFSIEGKNRTRDFLRTTSGEKIIGELNWDPSGEYDMVFEKRFRIQHDEGYWGSDLFFALHNAVCLLRDASGKIVGLTSNTIGTNYAVGNYAELLVVENPSVCTITITQL